jgi:hypothetical protein
MPVLSLAKITRSSVGQNIIPIRCKFSGSQKQNLAHSAICLRALLYKFLLEVEQQWPMYIRLDRPRRTLPMLLGLITLVSVGVLIVWDIVPQFFPPGAHDLLAAFPLAMIAFAYLVYQAAHRPARLEVFKAILLAIAFLSWAANQLWPNLPQATLFNDIAIALFVLDIFLVMIGWPATSPDESFAETYTNSDPE